MLFRSYGKVRMEWVDAIEGFYKNHPLDHTNYYKQKENEMFEKMGMVLYENCFSGQDSYDLAATNQYVFEKLCFSFIKPYIEKYNLDVVFSGGCALNVLFNQKLKEYLNGKNLNLYISPYPSDCGLSFGHFTYYQKLHIDPSPYCGIDILDRDKITEYYQKYNKKGKVFCKEISKIVEIGRAHV